MYVSSADGCSSILDVGCLFTGLKWGKYNGSGGRTESRQVPLQTNARVIATQKNDEGTGLSGADSLGYLSQYCVFPETRNRSN
jgi:hypothetical protein